MYKVPNLFLGIFLGQQNCRFPKEFQFSSVHSLSHVGMFATPQTAACQASLSIANSRSLLKLMSIKLVMPSKYFIFCIPLSSFLQPFPASGSFPMSQFFSSGEVYILRSLYSKNMFYIYNMRKCAYDTYLKRLLRL